MNNSIKLRPVEDSDLPMLERWLNQPYILKWYHDADEWLHEIRERHGDFKFLNHYIVVKSGEAIGFAQYYDCFDAQEEWYTVNKPNESFSIDYLIGEEKFLGQGYGKEIVKKLLEVIYSKFPEATILVQPEEENAPSCKALLANRFRYDDVQKYYILEQ